MSLSNNITSFLTFMAMALSVLIVATGIWISTNEDLECLKFIRWPLILFGVILFLVSLAGFVGSFCKIPSLLVVYLVFSFILIILFLVFVIFAFVTTHDGRGHPVLGRAYEEYQLSDFSGWLRKYVDDNGHWRKIRNCLSSSNVCTKLNGQFFSPMDYFNSHLSPLESGCCKPPTICGYNYISPTVWTNPVNQNADMDCLLWSNDQSQLCYNCASCRAGLLGDIRHQYKRINGILIGTLVGLIFVYLIGCSAFRNAQTEEMFRRYKQGFGR